MSVVGVGPPGGAGVEGVGGALASAGAGWDAGNADAAAATVAAVVVPAPLCLLQAQKGICDPTSRNESHRYFLRF